MKMVDEKDFPEIIEIYNLNGRKAANAHIRSRYSLKNPWSVMARIRRTPGYEYDENNDRFNIPFKHNEEQIFMSIDDLCKNEAKSTNRANREVNARTDLSMDKLIHELISDRLLELSRYVTLETSSRKILIDKTSMAADGYTVVIH